MLNNTRWHSIQDDWGEYPDSSSLVWLLIEPVVGSDDYPFVILSRVNWDHQRNPVCVWMIEDGVEEGELPYVDTGGFNAIAWRYLTDDEIRNVGFRERI